MKRNIVFVFLVFLLTAGCSSADFSGTWDSNWDEMELVQDEEYVTGTYAYDNGQLAGTVEGDTLTFTWWQQAATYDEATSSKRGAGYFVLSGNSLEGEWKYDGSTDWDGEWSATRS